MTTFGYPWRGRRRLLSGATALLALFAVAAFAPTSARAGCGDHVTFHLPRGLAATAAHAETPSPLPQAPCHGPTCSRRDTPPLAPPAPAPAPAPPGDDLWGRPVPLDASPAPAPSGWLDPSERRRRILGGADIFHPPRGA